MIGRPLRSAARIVLAEPALWPVGLAGFLVRGGIVVFALPILVLPSVVGLTTFIGPGAISAAGLSPRLVGLLALTTTLLVGWIVLATLVGAAVDRTLVRSVVVPEPPDGLVTSEPGPRPAEVGLAALFVVRLVSLVPFAIGVAIGGARLGQVGYQELILPSDATTPLVVRILAAAPEVVALLIVSWLIGELVGAVAVRIAIVDRRTPGRSLAGALGWIVRHPARSIGLLAATVVVGILAVAPAIVVGIAAWSALRTALLGGDDPLTVILLVGLFVLVWLAGLGVTGIVATWRSAAWSLAMVGDHRGGGPERHGGGTL